MKLSKNDFLKIKQWIYHHSRPIDFLRWKYLFENGSKEEVVIALSSYQNADGGFGHAIEPDCWCPLSSPIQTFQATELIFDLNFEDKNHPIIQGILKYLDSGADFVDDRWLFSIPDFNNYPHAPWWYYHDYEKSDFNPTATLVGFILKYASINSSLYKKTLVILNDLMVSFLKNPKLEMHSQMAFNRLIDYLDELNIVDIQHVKRVLKDEVRKSLKESENDWKTYAIKPSDFIKGPNSMFYEDNKDLVEKEIEFIIENRKEDGLWSTTWSWNQFEEEFKTSSKWWRSYIAIKYLLFLKNFNSLEM